MRKETEHLVKWMSYHERRKRKIKREDKEENSGANDALSRISPR